jgi:hypothetical protein
MASRLFFCWFGKSKTGLITSYPESFGYQLYNKDTETWGDLIKAADNATMVETSGGWYRAVITYTSGTHSTLRWTSGEATPLIASHGLLAPESSSPTVPLLQTASGAPIIIKVGPEVLTREEVLFLRQAARGIPRSG